MTGNPLISVIIPMYNAEKTIGQALKGLEQQTRKDFEVVVVDDGSADSSPRLVASFEKESRLPIKLMHQPNSGPAKARNLGAANSKGEIVIFLDSDCIPPPNWVEEMVRPLQGDAVGCNCGYKAKNGSHLVARYVDCEIARRHQRLARRNIDALASNSASFLKSVFIEAGGFDTQYTAADAEDFDLAFKLRKEGHRLAFTDRTFVYHYHPGSLRRYLQQQYSRGYWRVRLYLRNKDRIIKGDSYTGHEPQIQFILSNLALLSLPLMAISPYSLLAGFGILVLSNLPLGLWAGKKEKKLLLIAPLIASMRSLAAALGAYAGLVGNMLRLIKGWRSQ